MVAILVAVIVVAVILSGHRGHQANAEPVPEPDDDHKSPIRGAIPSNFPDPSLYYEKGTWYAFATTNAAGVLDYPDDSNNASRYTLDFGLANIQMATSSNFADWNLASLADQPLPATGNWTMGAHHKTDKPHISSTWAPAVIKRADGKFVMYYAAIPRGANPYPHRENDGKISFPHPHPHCVGAAVSTGTSPAGPYEALDDYLACPKPEGGAIDPEVMRDADGKIWVTYKVDGNNIGHGGPCGNTVQPILPTPIMLQQMEDDGVTKVGDPVQILQNNNSDGPLIEAPMLIRSPEGVYFLFYSSGCTRENTYVVKYATSRDIKGPYTRAKGTLLKTGDWGLEAPGSIGIVEDGQDGWNMAFHARVNYGQVGRVRAMFTTKLKFDDTKVTMVRDDSTIRAS
ncbi:glycoside hydrolase family 43 protein [Zasmidium cellare ATCC 36951]|uniref:Glycoside hydrolase family 43 protein n=1 Tax=Zasmidium cellare ATCC 36951 TaxID=1080233 RepID=A0A6A6CG74_ZASCE|nr:glycoside hydrolase family 43 protein [Zasmidium cellare ATCC 36951]KAF2166184.1 glycoside hydrolase family 43 protein [Zasmidium cellare ATCC 36951]